MKNVYCVHQPPMILSSLCKELHKFAFSLCKFSFSLCKELLLYSSSTGFRFNMHIKAAAVTLCCGKIKGENIRVIQQIQYLNTRHFKGLSSVLETVPQLCQQPAVKGISHNF